MLINGFIKFKCSSAFDMLDNVCNWELCVDVLSLFSSHQPVYTLIWQMPNFEVGTDVEQRSEYDRGNRHKDGYTVNEGDNSIVLFLYIK